MTARDTGSTLVRPDYASSAQAIPLLRFPLLSIATWSGVIPLCSGSLVFLLWLMTRADVFLLFGLFIILGGIAAFVAGTACLIAEMMRVRPAGMAHVRKRIVAAATLIANFPAAVGYMAAFSRLEATTTIIVQNAGTTTIDSFVVSAPGFTRELGPIYPAATKQVRFRPTTDGVVTFAMRQNAVLTNGTVVEYVSAAMGTKRTVIVNGANVVVR